MTGADNTLSVGNTIIGYQCLICPFEIEDEDSINEHMRSVHESRFGEEWEHSRAVYSG